MEEESPKSVRINKGDYTAADVGEAAKNTVVGSNNDQTVIEVKDVNVYPNKSGIPAIMLAVLVVIAAILLGVIVRPLLFIPIVYTPEPPSVIDADSVTNPLADSLTMESLPANTPIPQSTETEVDSTKHSDSISIEQVLISFSPKNYRLAVTIKNSLPQDVLIKKISLDADPIECSDPSSSFNLGQINAYTFSDTIDIVDTPDMWLMYGTVTEETSVFYQPLQGYAIWESCPNRIAGGLKVNMGFATSLLLPARQHSSFSILIPTSLKVQIRSLGAPDLSHYVDNSEELVDLAFQLIMTTGQLIVETDAQTRPIRESINFPTMLQSGQP